MRKSTLWLLACVFSFVCIRSAEAQPSSPAATVPASGHLFAVAGRRAYLVGAQSGTFPDIGHHIPGEMGGLWMHPIKVADGFWLGFGHGGNVEWLPAASSYTVTATQSTLLYDTPRGRVTETLFIPQEVPALCVDYDFDLKSTAPRLETLTFLVRTELRGVWLSEQLGLTDARDEARYDPTDRLIHARDTGSRWFAAIGCSEGTVADGRTGNFWGPQKTIGHGTSCALIVKPQFDGSGHAHVRFIISGSTLSDADAATICQRTDMAVEFRRKQARYEDLLDRSRLHIPDLALEKLFEWCKVDTEMLVRHVPGQGVGLGAGLPTYPWWFGTDTCYALQGVLALGQHETALDTLRLLARYARDAGGRVPHEIVTNGIVYNPGNTQETAHFVVAVDAAWRWTGDRDFLSRMFPLCRQSVFDYLLNARDTDHDLLPEGPGVTETAGLDWELVDTAVYTQQALVALAHMAGALGETETAHRAQQLSERLAADIEKRFWMDDEGLYGDMIASPRRLLERLPAMASHLGKDDAALRSLLQRYGREARSLPRDRERAWLFKNGVIFCPLEMGLASPDHAERVLRRMQSDEFTGPYGLYLEGDLRRETMTISSGLAAVAAARYGHMDLALDYLHRMASTQDKVWPAAPSEMSPDYGCIVQAWTAYGAAFPTVCEFFGVWPDAGAKRIRFAPHLPANWHTAVLSQLRVGNNRFGFGIEATDRLHVTLSSAEPDWTLDLGLARPWLFGAQPLDVIVDGRSVLTASSAESVSLPLGGAGSHTIDVRPSVQSARTPGASTTSRGKRRSSRRSAGKGRPVL